MKMTKQLTIAALLVAGTACANAAMTTFTNFNDRGNSSDTYTLDGGTLTATVNSGKLWHQLTSASNEWTNTAALTQFNAATGSSFAASDWSGMTLAASGVPGSALTLSLTFGDSYSSGDSVTIYTLATSISSTLSGINFSGLNNTAVQYALYNGNGFESLTVSGSSYNFASAQTSNQLVLFAITGTLTDSKSATITVGNKGAVSMVSFGTPIPEPSAFGLLAGLGALALAGTRRRRKKA